MNQKKREKTKLKIKKNVDDPLNTLYQIDIDYKYPLEKEALLIMIRVLDNIEEFGSFGLDLKNIIGTDSSVETKILSLLRTLIDGIQIEYSILSKKHYTNGLTQ